MIPSTALARSWTAPDGATFPYSFWGPASKEAISAVVVAVHGLSGAALDFEPLAARLSLDNIATFAPELRGQGNDPDPARRGDLARLEVWYEDLHAFFTLVRRQYPDAQIYYYGESMGAALLTRYLTQEPQPMQPDGLMLASPVVALATAVPLWQEILFRLFLWVRPQYRVDVRLFTKRGEAPKLVTRDEAHRQWFETASHKVQIFTFRFFKNLRELIFGCEAVAPRLTTPLLLLYAGKDIFIPPELVEKFFHLVGSREKELRFYPESYHLLLHDLNKEEVLDRIRGWLLRRIEIRQRQGAIAARFEI